MADLEKTIDAFTRGYLEAALWTEDPDPGSGEWQPSDWWNIEAIDTDSLKRAIEVCRDFQNANAADLEKAGTPEQNGHDFWLTRNGHGAGFWDRGYGELGDRLSKACKPYGEAYLYGPETNAQGGVDDEAFDRWDGIIYIQD